MEFRDLDPSLWKAVMQDLEKLILHYELGNKIISLGFDDKLRQYIAKWIKKEDKILEIGVGPGSFIKHIKASEITCVDPSEKMLVYTKMRFRKKNINCYHGFAENLPFGTELFDKIYCVFSFRDFFDKKASLREAYRVLKKNGLLIIMDIANRKNIITFGYTVFLAIIGQLISRIMGFKNNIYSDLIKTIKVMKKPEEYKKMAVNVGFRRVYIEYKIFGVVFIMYAIK